MNTSLCTRPTPAEAAPYADSPQWRNGKFRNAAPRHALGTLKTLAVMWRFLFGKPADTVPARPIPVQALSRAELLAAPDLSLWRLGHSTMLMKLGQQFWLTDPVFSERASPFTFMGPKRFHAPPLRIEDLPEITGVLLSHDHYDHLDRAAIERARYLSTQARLPVDHYEHVDVGYNYRLLRPIRLACSHPVSRFYAAAKYVCKVQSLTASAAAASRCKMQSVCRSAALWRSRSKASSSASSRVI